MNIRGGGGERKRKKERRKKWLPNHPLLVVTPFLSSSNLNSKVKGTRVHAFENNFVFQKSTVNVLYEQTIIEEKG